MYTTLISSQQLSSLLFSQQPATLASVAEAETSELLLVDCRHDLLDLQAGAAAYRAGHLPGAIFADMEKDLSGAKYDASGNFSGRHPLPEREQFLQTLRQWGVHPETQIVAYDAHGGMYAARLWWMMRWIGHTNVAVLEGGMQSCAAIVQLSTEIPNRPANENLQLRPSLVATVSLEYVLENLSSAGKTIVDARSADRYRGENETIDPVGGHIPGAKNRFFKDNLQSDGRFKPAAQLREEWSGIITDPALAIMQCGSGVTACHNLLALEVAGLSGAALFPGSWSQWCVTQPGQAARPVAVG